MLLHRNMEKAHFISFFSLPFRPLNENVASRMIAGKELMFLEHKAKKGHVSREEKHENEQLTLVMHGKIRVTVGGESHLLTAGDAVWIPSWAIHSIEVLEDCSVFEIFSPPRQEWLTKLS